MSCNISSSFRVRSGLLAGALFGIPLTIALEVLGAGGATWANSDYLGLRNKKNSNTWSAVAITVSVVALVRYLSEFYNYRKPNSKEGDQSAFDSFCHSLVSPFEVTKEELLEHPKSVIGGLLIGVPITFALEVLGAGAAIWGGSQYLSLRSDSNRSTWDYVSITVSLLALLRYAAKYHSEKVDPDLRSQSYFDSLSCTFVSPHKLKRAEFLEYPKSVVSFAVTGLCFAFALEMLGAGGAVWGSSDFLHLRNESNGSQWDGAAIGFFVFGFIRYIAKCCCESSDPDERFDGFTDGFFHSMVSPYEAVKKEFFEPEKNQRSVLLMKQGF